MAGTIAFDSGVVVNPNSQFPTRTVILEYVGWTVNPFASQVIQLIDTPNDMQDARQIISRSISWLSSSENAGGGYIFLTSEEVILPGTNTGYVSNTNSSAPTFAANQWAMSIGTHFGAQGASPFGMRMTLVYSPVIGSTI